MCQSKEDEGALRNGGAEKAGTLDIPRKLCGMPEQRHISLDPSISLSPYLPQMMSSLSRVKFETNAGEVKAPKLNLWDMESETEGRARL